jgi:hypothetical protein
MRTLCILILGVAACGGSNGNGGAGSGGGAGAGGGGSSAGEPASLAGITDAHNAARAAVDPPAATPIPPLSWDDGVAATAQAYADQCMFQHSGGQYGENIFAASNDASGADVVKSWVDEKQNYDYASNSCAAGKVCGHYTQVVWAKSLRLGCGKTACTQNSPFGSFNGGKWTFVVCNYDPAGNFVGEKPY